MSESIAIVNSKIFKGKSTLYYYNREKYLSENKKYETKMVNNNIAVGKIVHRSERRLIN